MLDILEEHDKQADAEIEELNSKIHEGMNRLLSHNSLDSSQEKKESNNEWVWEMVKTSGVFNKFMQEENEKMILLGAQIARMYLSGKSLGEISERTNLSEEKLKELVRGLD